MYPGAIAEHGHSEEMVDDASEQSLSTVTGSDNGQLPAATADLAKLMKSAILDNDLATINDLLAQGFEPNTHFQSGSSPLLLAIGKQKDIVKTLLDYGAHPNLPAPNYPPLSLASILGDHRALMLLLDKGANVNAHDNFDLTALHVAAFLSNDDTTIIKVQNCLLDSGADLNALDHKGQTPLHHAVDHYSTAVVNNLLQAGANPNISDFWGITPLTNAIINAPDSEVCSMVSCLLANKANPNIPDGIGNTALHLALEKNRPEVVEILLANGVNDGIPNARGETARNIATAKGLDILNNYIPAYQPMTLSNCARACIRSRLIENKSLLAKALAPDSDCLPLPNPIRTYLHKPLTL